MSLAVGFGGLLVLPSVNVSFEHSLLVVMGYDGPTDLPYLITLGAWTLTIVTHVLIRRISPPNEPER
ncbi:MAG: hypothetical protein ACQEP0_11115 [Natrinema limicola]